MFNRTFLFLPGCGQVRGMATLKDIRLRLKSVTNIQKITKSMKMVSAAKYSRAERELKPARPYGLGSQAFYEKAEVKPLEGKKRYLIVAMTSDRGLCGAVHSNIVKAIKAQMADADLENTRIICVGDKSRGMLQRVFPKNILMHFADIGKKVPTFMDATVIANEILNSGFEYDHGVLYFNRFKSVVSYQTSTLPIFSLETIAGAGKITTYDSLDDDVMRSYQEYSLASLVYYTLKENATSEQSSRMTAMDNASKNAGEMIDKLTLTFNRTRQAVITRELIEIISGASAL
uniref:ATP synthase subunit gamma n=1 Tax=Hemiscolopendra marginata TaxID=943146 RepID=A0A646QF05_9MYRI